MDKKTQRPPFLKEKNLTFRQWKEQKRREWRDVKRAMATFRLGCAYVPNHNEMRAIFKLMQIIDDGMTQRKWGP